MASDVVSTSLFEMSIEFEMLRAIEVIEPIIYETSNGYIAIAMTPLPKLGELLDLEFLKNLEDQKEWFTKRDEIKEKIGSWIINKTTKEWLDILEPADIWCAEVLDWKKMLEHEGFKILDMVQKIKRDDGLNLETLRFPIKIDNSIFKSDIAAPIIGQDNNKIMITNGSKLHFLKFIIFSITLKSFLLYLFT